MPQGPKPAGIPWHLPPRAACRAASRTRARYRAPPRGLASPQVKWLWSPAGVWHTAGGPGLARPIASTKGWIRPVQPRAIFCPLHEACTASTMQRQAAVYAPNTRSFFRLAVVRDRHRWALGRVPQPLPYRRSTARCGHAEPGAGRAAGRPGRPKGSSRHGRDDAGAGLALRRLLRHAAAASASRHPRPGRKAARTKGRCNRRGVAGGMPHSMLIKSIHNCIVFAADGAKVASRARGCA